MADTADTADAAGDTAAGDELALAQADELLPAQALRDTSFELIMDMARALDADIEGQTDLKTLQRAMRLQADLRERAARLVAQDIRLKAGEARVTAAHIRSAAAAAKAVVDQVATTRSRLATLGAVLDFVGAVLTGSGTAIVKAAADLHGKLKAA